MIDPTQLQSMSAEELRALAVQLMSDVRHK